jgi:hypothetical protein
VIRDDVRGDHADGDVLDAAPLDPPRRPLHDCIGIHQQRHHHRRLVRRPAMPFGAIGRVNAARSIAATASITNHAK